MSKDTGGPAFTTAEAVAAYGERYNESHRGLTIRDFFAAKAMQSTIVDKEEQVYWTSDYSSEECAEFTAKRAYEFADAMIAERNK